MTLPEDTLLENRYRIDGLLAHGGMGAIYRAFDTNLSTPVAIKENFFQTPHRIAQFKQEALMLARLRHPSLPRVIHHFSFEGQQYLVMDFIEGENLWEMIKRRGKPLDEREALGYIIQVCRAATCLHRQTPPIIHRDIKPQNIKITPAGRAMLVDFGIAKQVADDNAPTDVGTQAATPGFSPPEQYSGKGTSPASDVYALGATLYAVLAGKKPPNSVSLMVGSTKFEAPNLINPKISRQTNQVIGRAMQPKPHLRPQTVEQWQRQLEAVLSTISADRPEKDDTLASKSRPIPGKQETLVSASAKMLGRSSTGFWLVDSRGVGYPLGDNPLRIGRHPEADVTLEDINVSRFHTQVKVNGARCFVLDGGSANGTFLNGYRLGVDWYAFNQGDALIVGPARFYLTTTQPAKIAVLKPPPAALPQLPATKISTGKLVDDPRPTPQKTPRGFVAPLFIVLLVTLIAVLGMGGYLWVNPTALSYLNTAPASTPLIRAATETPATPPPSIQETQTLEADQAATAVALVELTAQTEAIKVATSQAKIESETKATPSKTPTLAATPVKTALPDSSTTPTALPTQRSTAAPLRTPTQRAAVASGPTVIPLEFTVSVAQLGRREVIDVDINPQNPKEVYALVKRDGIYKSVNGGDGPWARIDLNGEAITALAIDPQNPARLYAPTWNAVLKSTDGGNTWQAKTNGLVSNRSVDLVTVHPNKADILFAGVGENLVVSMDQGETWDSGLYGTGLGVSRLNGIVVNPFDSEIVYVVGPAAAVYKSGNGGHNFEALPYNVGKGAYGLAAHPGQKDVVLVGINSAGAGIIKTENGFDFRPVSDGLIFGGADSAYSAIAFAPGNPNIVYAGSGFESEPDAKGIFKSTDGGESWQSINIGLVVNPDTGYPHYVKSIAVHPTNPAMVFAATGSGLYKSIDGGKSWELK